MSREQGLLALAARLGWTDAPDLDLLNLALRHVGATGGAPGSLSNERLEFLGDRVLGLVVAEWLYREFPRAKEGQLAPKLNALVSKAGCARAARFFALGPLLIVSKGDDANGARENDSILADAMEAVIAASYLSGGLEQARVLIERGWADQISGAAAAVIDPKNQLQEWAHRNGRGQPVYTVLEQDGPDHAPRFRIKVAVKGKSAEATAGSKREAERQAAIRLLETVGIPNGS